MDPFSGQKEKGDALRKYIGENAAAHLESFIELTRQLPNPPGWNDEPGMQPINWAERVEHQKAAGEWLMSQDVDRHYQIAFEAWQRQQTRPETRWEFADRMAKQQFEAMGNMMGIEGRR